MKEGRNEERKEGRKIEGKKERNKVKKTPRNQITKTNWVWATYRQKNWTVLLQDVYPGDKTSHEEALGIISYIGCALSLVGLTLTIITILLFK